MCKKLISSGLSRIIISLDGFSQEIYEQYRKGGDVQRVKKGISSLIGARKELHATNPIIVVQTLAFEHNKEEIEKIQKWCRSAGVDKLEIKTAQMNEFGDGSVKPAKDHSRYENISSGAFNFRKSLQPLLATMEQPGYHLGWTATPLLLRQRRKTHPGKYINQYSETNMAKHQ